jgi:hypothetical protein
MKVKGVAENAKCILGFLIEVVSEAVRLMDRLPYMKGDDEKPYVTLVPGSGGIRCLLPH